MKPEILPLLTCPACPGVDLSLKDPVFEHERVFSGGLRCAHCSTIYPIVQGIPRFLNSTNHGQNLTVQDKIARNFGEAWQLYAKDRVNPYTQEQFLDWIAPLTPPDFKNRRVLDLGCGLAGFSEFAASYGPRHIVGLDISSALDSAIPLLQTHENLSLIQGDLLNPPFKEGSFDLIYSIGVLHHLEQPEAGFQSAASLLKPGGRLFFWVYGRENNALVVYGVDPLRKLLCHLPVPIVRYGLALPISLLLWPWLHTIYHPGLQRFFDWLPYAAYFRWLRRYGFFYVWGMVTDQLIPPRTFYLKREQIEAWFQRASDMVLDVITARNRISWRCLGHKKTN
jgi:SAM-dependent methyltransferase/uncharacterized protein YbaR (Trm112 family)